VLSRLVTGEVDGQRLTDEEIVSFMRCCCRPGRRRPFAGSAARCSRCCTIRPQLAEVVADRALVSAALEETLRWETPVLFVGARPRARSRSRVSRSPRVPW